MTGEAMVRTPEGNIRTTRIARCLSAAIRMMERRFRAYIRFRQIVIALVVFIVGGVIFLNVRNRKKK